MPLTEEELKPKLWRAADILRGQIDSSDYKNYIFSMLFLKRLSDRFAEEVDDAVAEGVSREVAERERTSTSSSSRPRRAGARSSGSR